MWHSFTGHDAETGEARPFYLMGAWGEDAAQLFDRHDKLVDRVHAENIGCEHGEYDKLT